MINISWKIFLGILLLTISITTIIVKKLTPPKVIEKIVDCPTVIRLKGTFSTDPEMFAGLKEPDKQRALIKKANLETFKNSIPDDYVLITPATEPHAWADTAHKIPYEEFNYEIDLVHP